MIDAALGLLYIAIGGWFIGRQIKRDRDTINRLVDQSLVREDEIVRLNFELREKAKLSAKAGKKGKGK